jgi:hypothetical protein
MPGDFLEKRQDMEKDYMELHTYDCPICHHITCFYTKVPDVPCCAGCNLQEVFFKDKGDKE